MSFLFIGSTGDRAGHTLLTWAIGRRLMEKGRKVGFFKPFGTNPFFMEGLWTDHDAFLFKDVLRLKEPLDQICPFLMSEDVWRQKGLEEMTEEVRSVAQRLAEEKDVLLIMGSKHIFSDDASCPVPDMSVISGLNADFILITRYRKISRSVYSILFAKSMLKDRVKGVILNRVPPENLEEIRSQMIPSLSQKGISVTTILPEDPALSFRSLREICEIIDGEVLWGEKDLHQPVGRLTVGSADLKGDLLLFKRVYNKIILLKPFPVDEGIQEPFDQRSIAGILLTSGRDPAPIILEASKKAHIPLIVVKEDTFSALERLEQSPPLISPKDEAKVIHFTELMDRDGALDVLLRSVGLTR